MMHQEGSTDRFELPEKSRIKIGVQRYSDLIRGQDAPSKLATVADINCYGAKIITRFKFEDLEPCILRLPVPSGGIIRVASEIRWSESQMNKTWLSGCKFSSDFPGFYLNQIASFGLIDRRKHERFEVFEPVTSICANSNSKIELTIVNISATGVGLLLEHPVLPANRYRIRLSNSRSMNVEVVHRTKAVDGYYLGCLIDSGKVEDLLHPEIRKSGLNYGLRRKSLKLCP